MDRLDTMSLLVAIVDCGSFSGASRKFALPVATVSRRIAELERSLNTKLLLRTTRSLSLTDAGSAYLKASRRILEAVEDAERMAAGEYIEPRGELLVTAPIVFGRTLLLPLMAQYLDQFPKVDVRLQLDDRIVNLAEEHIDLAIRIGSLSDSSFVATRLGSCRRVVCASPDYLDRYGYPRTPDDLSQHICITFEKLAAGKPWTFHDPAGGRPSFRAPKSRLAVTTASAVIGAAVEGVGVAHVLSYQVAELVHEGKLEVLLPEYEPPPIPIHLLYLYKALMPAKTRSFIDLAVPALRLTLMQNEAWLEAARDRVAQPSTTSRARTGAVARSE